MLWLDLETFSPVDIRQHGLHAYAEQARVLLFAWAIDDGPAQVWQCDHEPMPGPLVEALFDPTQVVVAHNAEFDRTILEHAVPALCPALSRWRDTAVMALAHALPMGLDKLCQALRVPTDQAKDKEGKRLIKRFCCPPSQRRNPHTGEVKTPPQANRETHPEHWARFVEYARMDIVAMRECYRRMPKWNNTREELDYWHMDQRINGRGVNIDRELVEAGIWATTEEQGRLATEIVRRTAGTITRASQVDTLLQYLREVLGVELPDLQKATIANILENVAIPEEARELLLIRQSSGKSSTAKYTKIRDYLSSDGRLRGLLQFCGASRTGRWCLAKGSMVLVKDTAGVILERPIEAVRDDDLVYDGHNWVAHEGVVSNGLRECITHDGITATPEHIVYVSDATSMTLGEAQAQGWRLWRGFSEEAQRIPSRPLVISQAETYDILNAGPRNRFMCNRRIVSNSGKGPQFHNLPQGRLKPDAAAQCIAAFKSRTAHLHYEDVLLHSSYILRGVITAPPGHTLLVADLANIEGRMCAWLCGEWWKLEAFTAFDEGRGPDLYILAYARSFAVPPEKVTSENRTIGKVLELSMQYRGGADAFANFARLYALNLEDLADQARPTLDAATLENAERLWDWLEAKGFQRTTLDKPVWVVCDSLKQLWRAIHPEIVAAWRILETAAHSALANPGIEYPAARCLLSVEKGWLRIQLPSGRSLCYPDFQLEKTAKGSSLSYMGTHQTTKQWVRQFTSGGKLLENITQAASRDILVHGLRTAELQGLNPVLSIHDEVICEVPVAAGYSVQHLIDCLTARPHWCRELPLAAAGFESTWYRK